MSNIWQIGSQLYDSSKSYQTHNSSVLFVGNKKSGKTSIIYKLIDKKDEPRETLALHYYYFQLKNNNLQNQICNVWELGESGLSANLFNYAINGDNISDLTIVICIDLSKPEEMLSISNQLISAIKNRVDSVLSKCSPNDLANLRGQMIDRLGEGFLIKGQLIQLPIIILGNKYDLFKNMDSDDRKTINRFLRCFSANLGASLVYTSIHQDSLINRFRRILMSTISGEKVDKSDLKIDHNKPLWITFGSDLLSDLNNETIESLEILMQKRWKQSNNNYEKLTDEDDPTKYANFAERDIDLYRLRFEQVIKQSKQQKSFIPK